MNFKDGSGNPVGDFHDGAGNRLAELHRVKADGTLERVWQRSTEPATVYESYSVSEFDGKHRAQLATDPAGGMDDVLEIQYVDIDDGYDDSDADSFRGLNGRHQFNDLVGYWPEVAHVRYDLYFPTDFEWHTTGYGGTKLPGFANQTNSCGYAGNYCTGEGFSARSMAIRPDHIWDESGGADVPYGQYVYDDTGDTHHHGWGGGGSLGEWFTVDQQIIMNTTDVADGRIVGWINGEKVFDRGDYRFFTSEYEDDLGVEQFRSHFYFGGTWGSPAYQSIYYRDLKLWATDVPSMEAS